MLLIAPCVPVIPGASYDGSMDYRIPAGQGVTSVPSLEIAWYSGTSCGALTFLSANSLVDGNTADGVWHRAESTYAPIAPANATFASFRLNLSKLEAGGTATAYYDNPVFKPQAPAARPRPALPQQRSLSGDQHLPQLRRPERRGKLQAMTADTGYFWFFSAANVEVVIKVINGCGFNSAYWIYAGGLTDVDVQIEVKDTRSSAGEEHCGNTLGTPFQPIGDIQAFATCP